MASSLIRSCMVTRLALRVCRSSCAVYSIQDHVPRRTYKKHEMSYLREMYERRLEVGPEKERRRSEWINWNYDCEIYSFGKRLGEDLNDATVRQAFVNSSYIEREKRRREELGIDIEEVPLQLEDNSNLSQKGSELMSTFVKVYLRNIYPFMFEECVCAIHDYLMTEEVLAHVAKHIGCEDLILCEEFPVTQTILSDTFKAVVGAVLEDKGQNQAEAFVRDFIMPQLIDKDINELWDLINPMGLLTAVLALSGRGAPEPRLLWKSGASSIMSLYWVGLYSDKQLVSKSPGETVMIAEEMAAREAIKKVMKTEDNRSPMIFGEMADSLKLDYNKVNVSAEAVIRKHFEKSEPHNDAVSS